MIAEIIKVLKCDDFYNAGKYTEIAKGKHEMVHTWSDFLRKIKRQQK
tara:strand:+ start:4653 stop:4793 length:141 start_codon:yes stop_codon:yes gene_type:complete